MKIKVKEKLKLVVNHGQNHKALKSEGVRNMNML